MGCVRGDDTHGNMKKSKLEREEKAKSNLVAACYSTLHRDSDKHGTSEQVPIAQEREGASHLVGVCYSALGAGFAAGVVQRAMIPRPVFAVSAAALALSPLVIRW